MPVRRYGVEAPSRRTHRRKATESQHVHEAFRPEAAPVAFFVYQRRYLRRGGSMPLLIALALLALACAPTETAPTPGGRAVGWGAADAPAGPDGAPTRCRYRPVGRWAHDAADGSVPDTLTDAPPFRDASRETGTHCAPRGWCGAGLSVRPSHSVQLRGWASSVVRGLPRRAWWLRGLRPEHVHLRLRPTDTSTATASGNGCRDRTLTAATAGVRAHVLPGDYLRRGRRAAAGAGGPACDAALAADGMPETTG